MVKINKIWSDFDSMQGMYSIRTDVFEEEFCTICYVQTPFDILKFMIMTGIENLNFQGNDIELRKIYDLFADLSEADFD